MRFDVDDVPALRGSRTLSVVLVVAALSVLVRLVGLGGRVMHWDEGRVGYWVLRYHETGVHSYRPIVHGPFLPIVNDFVFAVLPMSDFAVRLPVALVGGLLPLAAWLFRDSLRDSEVVAFAAVLALNPLMVYYSRFMRNDVLVAAFSLVALGFLLRLLATARPRYLYAAAASFGLAVTTKENALLYVLCFLGAGTLVLEHRLVTDVRRGSSAADVLAREWPAAVARWLRRLGGSVRSGAQLSGVHAVGAVATFLLVAGFFYAPRPELWQAFGNPTALPGVAVAATVEPTERFFDTWVNGTHQDHDYLPFLHDYLETLAYGAPVVLAFGTVGVVTDRYSVSNPGFRPLVAFALYWGLASVVGYPIATDIQAPWATIHAVVPFAIPAAVGLAVVGRVARESLDEDDVVSAGLAAVLLVAAVGGAVALNADYWNSAAEEDKQVLQWAQPGNDLRQSLDDVRTVAEENEGTDVLFYGTQTPNGEETLFYVDDEASADQAPPGGPAWHSRLPLPWYMEQYGAEVTSTAPDTPPATALEDAPPVVVAYDWNRSELEPHLDGYVVREHAFKLWGEDIVVFVDRSALAA